MNKQCEIAQDLLPLYVDGACSESSAAMVTEHLESCPECKALYEKLCSDTGEEILKTEMAGVVAKYEKKAKKKKQKWVKFRHRIMWGLAYCVLYPYTRIKYRVKIKKYKEKKKRHKGVFSIRLFLSDPMLCPQKQTLGHSVKVCRTAPFQLYQSLNDLTLLF